MMDSFLCAIATDDGENYTSSHFGDAESYIIYELTEFSAELIKKISNSSTSEEEGVHADPQKAGSVAKMLKKENATITAAHVYGPNLKRIKSKFVCLLMAEGRISNTIPLLLDNFCEIRAEWEKGEGREYLDFRNK